MRPLLTSKTRRLSAELINLRSERSRSLLEPFLSDSDDLERSLVIEDDPRTAVIFFVLSSVLLTANLYAAQALIFRHPDMSIMQMTFARGIAATAVMLAWVNRDAKRVIVTQIKVTCLPSLVFRCAQGALSLFNGFLLLSYFYVSTIQIVCALTPMFTCLLAYFAFGTKITPADVRALVAIFVALGLILTGDEQDTKTSEQFDSASPFTVLVLFSQPLMLASSQIAMRQMRKMNHNTVTAYQNMTLLVFACFLLLAQQSSFNFMLTFDW